ncbi:hypothetical protein [Oligoflexus tunisiensis]|uniref:hypothetical protein n=1 Tax=Oligoflexus tunisiensis TaxID=708132 RepID=UPI00114CAB41|nr:hypothetical protein [Oligoflexus tunisiensis]
MPCKVLLLCFVLVSCQANWNNSLDQVAVTCGISREDSQKNYLQILDEAGQSLSGSQVSTLVAEFRDASGQRTELRPTAGGCVEIPDKLGELAVVDSRSKAAVYWKREGAVERFPGRRLIGKPVFTFETLCQGGNQFAHTQLKRDWSVTAHGSMQNVRLLVQARNVHDERATVLYTKEFGEELALPETWSTGVLPEGQYQLEVFQHDLTDGLEQAPRLVSFPAQCPLTVLHHAPTLLGLADGTREIDVVDLDEGLAWKPSGEHAELFVCMEERSTLPQDLQNGNACQAVAQCQNPANFQPLKSMHNEHEGLFNVFAFAKDRADNQGATSCRTVIFSNKAPDFDVRWNKDRWNRDGFVLDEEVPILKAQVSGLYHEDIPLEQLEASLECRAEIILRSVETVTTPSVTCTAGRCKGLPLDTFRPCDAALGIGIFQYWRSSYSHHATLRVHVRATDRAGHERRKTLNLVLDSEHWQRFPIELPPGIELPPYQLAEDAEGNLLGLAGEKVGIWKDGNFINISPGPGLVESVRTRDNGIYFFKGEKPDALQVMRWHQGDWQPVGEPLNFDDKYPSVAIHPEKGFWLYSPQLAWLIQDHQIQKTSLLPEFFNRETQLSVDQTGRIWAFFENYVYSLDREDQWQKLEVPKSNDRDDTVQYRYLVDRFGHLWMIASDHQSSPPLLKEIVRWDNGQSVSYPDLVRKVSHATRMADSFVLDADFTAMIGNFRWSEQTLSWNIHPLFEGIPDHVDAAVFWNARDMAFTTLEGRSYLEHNGELKQLPLSMSLGESPFITKTGDVFVTGFDSFARYHRRPWINRNADRDDMENVIGLWMGVHGKMRACSRSLKVWELSDGIWISRMDVSDMDSGMVFSCYEDRASNLFMHTSRAFWVQAVGSDQPRRIADSAKGKGSPEFFEDRTGIVWFTCLNPEGNAALCAYEKDAVSYFPLPQPSFPDDGGRLCGIDTGATLYFSNNNFSVTFQRKTRQLAEWDQNNTVFPDESRLSVDGCYRVDGSTILIAADESYYLWNSQNQRLQILNEFDSGFSEAYIMPEQELFLPSADGFLYLMALEADSEPAEPKLLSEKLNRGHVFRLAPDGSLTEVLSPSLRVRAFDQSHEMPQMLFTDRYGMLWGLSISSLYWTHRLIQFTDPWAVGY